MIKLSKLTLDALIPLPIAELKSTKTLASRFQSITDLMSEADGVVLGRITSSHLFRIESGQGLESYFTTIRLQGHSLSCSSRGQRCSLDISFQTGSIRDDQGRHHPEAPEPGEVKLGKRVLVFHRWMEDLGGGMRGNGLVGMRSGLYAMRTELGREWVVGRGSGFGIAGDLPLSELTHRLGELERA